MENCYSIKDSEIFCEILNSIKRNDCGILDFIVQDLLDKEIDKKPEDPIMQENGMVINIDLSRRVEGSRDSFRLYLSGTGTIW